MSLLDDASLLVTPNAEKEGKLYSIIPTNGNGDFSVTRATTATRVNDAGLVELVPYNLLQYSEQFSNAAWSANNATVTVNNTTAPNGTLTADTITNVSGSLIGQALTFSTGQTFTFSVYLKRISGTGIINIIDVNGNLVPVSVTNDWQRFSITSTTTSTTVRAYFRVMTTGDSIAAWGAQLVEGTSALDYQMTETRLNIPRLDYSLGSCPNILLEPQRTNLALRSEEFDNAYWTKSTTSVTANSTTSPSGILNADSLTGLGGASSTRTLQSGLISATSGTAYTATFYAKKDTNNFIQIFTTSTFGGMFANFDLNNGVVGTVGTITGSNPTSSITNVGNGWYRCTMTLTSASTGSGSFGVYLVTSASAVRNEQNSLSTSVFLWGAQLEAGAYATSYIPTTSASVTRNGDVISRGNIFTNGLITASGGTWFVDIRNNRVLTRDGAANGLYLTDATSVGFGFRIKTFGTARLLIAKVIASAETTLYNTLTDNLKIAIKWNGTTADIFVNGVKVVSATAFTDTAMQLIANNLSVPFNINSMALFPTPLTDTQCIALTT